TEGSERTLVSPVPLPGPGSPVLRYQFATPSGGLLPNTVVRLGFRVTLADGSVVDGPVSSLRYDDTRYAWQTLSGSLVRVHWVQGGDSFGRQALAIAERAVSDAASLLGVTEGQPIDFFVYADRTAFYDVLGPAARENVGAAAFPEIRTVFANISTTDPNDPVVGIYIPHELTHIVFGDATDNPYHAPLHWLNEGLAVYLSQGYDAGSRSGVEDAVSNHTLMPLTSLAGQFPTQGDRFALAYDESVSAVDYLVRHFGRDALVRLIRSYAGGVSDDEAFKAGIGVDQAEFEVAWLADLGAPAPSPFGPRPAPAGPVPPDWLATAGAGTSGVPQASGDGSTANPSGGMDWLLDAAVVLIVIAGLLIALNVMDRRRTPPPDDNPKPW
ncbi:MAG TPA: peptidase MA family metallohydrolase, partial [Candidatus Limnocylindrales bacterium]